MAVMMEARLGAGAAAGAGTMQGGMAAAATRGHCGCGSLRPCVLSSRSVLSELKLMDRRSHRCFPAPVLLAHDLASCSFPKRPNSENIC